MSEHGCLYRVLQILFKVWNQREIIFLLELSVTLNFHPQGRNVNDVTNEGKS